MDRNTTIAFILIGAILVTWLYLNSPEPTKETMKGSDTTRVEIDTLQKPEKETTKKQIVENEIISDTTGLVGEQVPEEYKGQIQEPGRIITIETEVAIHEFSTRGANIHKVFLKRFNNWYSLGAENENLYQTAVQLINYTSGNSYDISFVTNRGRAVNTKDYTFKTEASDKYELAGSDSLEVNFKLELDANRSISKKYVFYGDKYLVSSKITLYGMENLISNNTFDLVWENGIRFVEENTVNEAGYSSADIYYGDEKVVIDAPSDGEKTEKDFNGRVDWVAVRNKYFAAVMIPQNPSDVEGTYVEGYTVPLPEYGRKEIYNTRIKLPYNGNKEETQSFKLYIGPVDYDLLKGTGYKLENLVDFGSFFGLKFVVRPIAEYILLPLFNFIHLFIPNYGFVIIVFSLIIKVVLYPLTRTQFRSMKKMQLLQPKINEIKEKFKEDPQKMNKETMKLYQTYGINPAGGCLPLLLQMPIFIALWGLFQAAIELRQQPFLLWIDDLSLPDVVYDLGFKLPLFGVQDISGLALLMGITTFVQQKMSVKDPKQQALVYMMPIMLTILFMSFPSGLNLYYFMFNVFSIAQQYYINHKHTDIELVPVDRTKKKPGFMSRLMEAAEQQAKQQQKKRK